MSKYKLAALVLVSISLIGQSNKMRYGFLPSLDLIKVAVTVAKRG